MFITRVDENLKKFEIINLYYYRNISLIEYSEVNDYFSVI